MGNSPTWLPTSAPDICIIFLCLTEKKFKTFKILFSTRLIRESDNFLHIILFSIHFFERTPLKHVEKKHGFEMWRVTVATHTHPPIWRTPDDWGINILDWGRDPKRLQYRDPTMWAWLPVHPIHWIAVIGRNQHVTMTMQGTVHVYNLPITFQNLHDIQFFITRIALTVFH